MTKNQTEPTPIVMPAVRFYRDWWVVTNDGRVINTTGYQTKNGYWWFPEIELDGKADIQCFNKTLDAVNKAIENEMIKVNLINHNLRKLQERREHLL